MQIFEHKKELLWFESMVVSVKLAHSFQLCVFLGLQVVAGVPNASAIQLDTSDVAKLEDCVSKVT